MATRKAQDKKPDQAPLEAADTTPDGVEHGDTHPDQEPATYAGSPEELEQQGKEGASITIADPEEGDEQDRHRGDRATCKAEGCERPEYEKGAQLCGAHNATRPDLRPRR